MSEMFDRIRSFADAIRDLPREAWMHTRLVDGRWEIMEKGEAPPGWRELSHVNPMFRIDHHVPVEVGDRIVVSEDIYEVLEGKELRRLVGAPTTPHREPNDG